MNKRKLLTLALTLCMVAILAIGGTLAYFTDTDGATNVMVTGNVKIIQNEQQRDGNGALEDFEDEKKLAPYTGSVEPNGVANKYDEKVTVGSDEYDMFDNDKNAIDKIVTVTNEGTEEAYVRTLFAFEVPKNQKDNVYDFLVGDRVLNLVTGGQKMHNTGKTFKYGQEEYLVCYYYYKNNSKLAAGKTTEPSLLQVYLNANADNEWYENVGPKYKILALSQATQTQGFSSAEEALNTAFGNPSEATEATFVEWFAPCVEITIKP